MEETMEAELEARVARGVGHLDRHQPDWWRPGRVTVDELDMASCYRCVLGQLYGSYWRGVGQLFYQSKHASVLANELAYCLRTWGLGVAEGFAVEVAGGVKWQEAAAALTVAWQREIAARRRDWLTMA